MIGKGGETKQTKKKVGAIGECQIRRERMKNKTKTQKGGGGDWGQELLRELKLKNKNMKEEIGEQVAQTSD